MRTRFVLPVAVSTLVVFTLLSPVSGAAGRTPDVSISHVEVTQAVQNLSNTIPLVARKGTAVRVSLNTSGSSVPGVTGKLHVLVNGTEVTPVAGLNAINQPFTAPAAANRSLDNGTLNFEMPAPTAIPASFDVDFTVDITVPGDPNTANNSSTVNNLPFSTRRTPLLFFTRVNWCGTGLAPLSFVQSGTGDAMVRGILPVNDGDPVLYRQGLFPTANFCNDNGDGVLDALSSEGSALLDFLEACRQLIVSSGVGASNRVFLYGWLNGNPINGNGLAQVGGRVAFGNTDPIRGQRSYAHELTHNFGFNHNNFNLDEVDWDVGGRLINNPATNNTTARAKPTSLFDIQVAGLLTNQAYIRSTQYTTLFNDPTLTPSFVFPFHKFVAIVRGFFDPGDPLGGRIQLEPIYRYPWESQPTIPKETKQPFLLRVFDTNRRMYDVPFSPTNADDPNKQKEDERPGSFQVAVPVDPKARIASVQIIDNETGKVLRAMKGSAAAPKVVITSPKQGAELGRAVQLTWEGSDADTSPAALRFQAAWSWDGGKSFVPVGVDIAGRSLTFPTAGLRRARGTGLLRVFVSDGTNTSFSDVGGLTLV